MLVDFVEPAKWYAVNDVAEILGFERDTIIRLVKKGHLEAFTLPEMNLERNRDFKSRRIKGAEILRFVKTYLGKK